MKLVDELFIRYVPKEKKLIPYGFSYENGKYLLSKLIHNNEFEMRIVIKDKKISAKLIDTNFGDEFNQINMDVTGSFVASLKEECSEIFLDIRDKCFEKELFIFPQTNRIAKAILDKYYVEPEFLWDKFPGFGVFRNKTNQKWFGIIMNLPKNKIVGDSKDEIEVINIKLDDKVPEYLNRDGIYPSYHMSKKNWVSVLLDDSLTDEEVMELIDLSNSSASIVNEWIVPANPKYCDVEHMFDKEDIQDWKQGRGIKVGDIVYMYVAAPISAIMFKCEVMETDIPYNYVSKELTVNKIMRIKLLERIDPKIYSFEVLNKEYGVPFIRGPRSMPKKRK